MLPGETISSGAVPECCGQKLTLQVLRSAAGYYVGTRCDVCGPYSRETGYMKDRKTADACLVALLQQAKEDI